MWIFTAPQIEAIIGHATRGLPNEACGLLAGRVDRRDTVVEKIYPLRNADQSPMHFSMFPQEQFRAIADMRANGWQLLGNFHSHPASPARPSAEDIRLAFDPGLAYFILSLAQKGHPILNGFHIEKGNVHVEEYVVRPSVPESRNGYGQ